jgi:hypothetical protein
MTSNDLAVGVEFAGATGSSIMLEVEGADKLLMDFPGVGARNLTRFNP